MDHREVGKMWDGNADAWTQLARAGYDVYRDKLNAPAFLGMLPDVSGLLGLDIGCGEGYNTRLASRRGARMVAFDVSPKFARHAHQAETEKPLGIQVHCASAVQLPFRDSGFDFAMATMSFMDIPETDKVIAEAYRVLKPGGFLQFSISHPCFVTPRWKWVRDDAGERIGVICGDYFTRTEGRVDEWIFGAAPPEIRENLPKFRVPRFQRTLSDWLNLLLKTGFALERFEEPCADEETANACPDVADTRIVAFFLMVRCRKPAGVSRVAER